MDLLSLYQAGIVVSSILFLSLTQELQVQYVSHCMPYLAFLAHGSSCCKHPRGKVSLQQGQSAGLFLQLTTSFPQTQWQVWFCFLILIG